MTTIASQPTADSAPHLLAVLPATLLELPLQRLALEPAVLATTDAAGLLTVGNVLQTETPLPESVVAAIRSALEPALSQGLLQFAAESRDWPTVRAQLLGPLSDAQRGWFAEFVGLEQPPVPRPLLAQRWGVPPGEVDDRADDIRATLAARSAPVLARLRQAAAADLRANDGVAMVEHAPSGTLLHTLAHAGADRLFGLRLLAFLCPNELHFHRNALFAISPRRFRRLLHDLGRLVPPHRLPLPVDTILTELQHLGQQAPRGVVLHLLRSELHIPIELDPQRGEMASRDPRSTRVRLAEILQEHGQMTATDLVFAWRERFRGGSRARILRQLRTGDEFVQTGPELWALRSAHAPALAAVQPIVDRIARQLAQLGGRHHVADLLANEQTDATTPWLVLDRLAHDPRVRMLGRGDACAATHRRSRVLEITLQAMRKAAGDVVVSMFVDNQAPEHRRLITRLLRHNRLFVETADDRIDTLSNWPFNEERLRRLLALVDDHLRHRAGYAPAAALKVVVDKTDLGGDWLTATMLGDILRRHGPFDLLPGGVVARADLMLGASVRRSLRQALREAGVPLTVDEVLHARPELSEFADGLHALLASDPLVQTFDGVSFQLG